MFGRVEMKFDISKTEKSLGESFELYLSEKISSFEYNGAVYDFAGPVSIEARYLPQEGHIAVFGDVSAKLKTDCARCLCDVEFDLKIEFNERFSRDRHEDDIYLFEGHDIGLEKAILDNIMLNLPMYVYCKPDCKGLCVHCGIDLNKEKCDCEEENLKANSPFNILGELFSDDEEV